MDKINDNRLKNKLINRLKAIDEVVLFIIFLVGFIIILTIPMMLKGKVLRLGVVSTFTPSMSAMLVLKINNSNSYPKRIFDIFLLVSGVAIFVAFIDGFYELDFLNSVQVALLVFEFIFLFIIFSEDKKILAKYNLNGGSFKKVMLAVLCHVIFIHILLMVMLVAGGGFKQLPLFFSQYNFIGYIGMLINYLIISGLYMFGEEYGWRGFLQSRLQNKFGKRIGVLLVGVIWGLWHVNVWFFRIEPQLLVVFVLDIIISSAFFLLFMLMLAKKPALFGLQCYYI